MRRTTLGSRTRRLLITIALLGITTAGKAANAPDGQTSGSQAGDLVALEIKLPKPVMSSINNWDNSPLYNPMNNLDMSDIPKKQPSLLVPRDVKLLSLHKKVTASDQEPIQGELSMITDGDKQSLYGCFVELAPDLQWVQIDLGASAEIFAVVIWHFHYHWGRVYHDVIVHSADDPEFASSVKTLFNNDYDNSTGFGIGKDKEYLENYQGKLIDIGKADQGKPVRARYLRFYSNGNSANKMNHYSEIDVYGRPLK